MAKFFLSILLAFLPAALAATPCNCAGGAAVSPIDPPNGEICEEPYPDTNSIAIVYAACPCSDGAVATGALIYTQNVYPAQPTTVYPINTPTLSGNVYNTITLSYNVAYSIAAPNKVSAVEGWAESDKTSVQTLTYTPLYVPTVYTAATTTLTYTYPGTASMETSLSPFHS